MPMTGPSSHERSTSDTNGVGQGVPRDNRTPALSHRMKHDKSILALAVSSQYIFAGTQGGEILVSGGEVARELSVLTLSRSTVSTPTSADESSRRTKEAYLACACRRTRSGSSRVRQTQLSMYTSPHCSRYVHVLIFQVWCTSSFKHIYALWSPYDIGDIFCVAYSSLHHTVYLGAQNTSIQWYDLKQKDARPRPALASHPSQRKNRFFDSLGPGGAQTPRPIGADEKPRDAVGGQELQIDSQDIYQFAHFGYVHCMLLGKGILPEAPSEEVLVSGGGDGRILLWRIDPTRGGLISNICALEDGREEGESILSLAREGSFLYSGRFDGEVNVWDLETRQLVRSLKANTGDVHTLTLGAGVLFAGGKSGVVHVSSVGRVIIQPMLMIAEIQRALRDDVDFQSAQRADPCICIHNVR